MAQLALLANSPVGIVFPTDPGVVVRNYKLLNAVTAGQAVYRDGTTSKGDVADASVAGKQQFRGIVLEAGNPGDTVPVVSQGELYGFDLSGLAYDSLVYLDTAGKLATAPNATKTVVVGRVSALTDNPTLTKVLKVAAWESNNW